jgi:hypothetical protein
MSDPVPTAREVIDYLNGRFEERGLPYRVGSIAVLPYVSPMWSSNWGVPELDSAPEREIIEEEIREARWRFPQVLE